MVCHGCVFCLSVMFVVPVYEVVFDLFRVYDSPVGAIAGRYSD
jgi:hypothetical protein